MVFGITSDDVGLSRNTMIEEDITLLQLAALYPANKYYAVVFFCFLLWGTIGVAVSGFTCYSEGDIGFAFECLHQSVVGANMLVQIAAHNYYSATLSKYFRKMDENYYSYNDTMDDDSRKFIADVAHEKKQRKLMFGRVFKVLIVGCVGGVLIKSSALHLIRGQGLKEVDGLNWIIYEAPLKVYVPYSDQWGPYLIGYACACIVPFEVGFACSGSISCFIRFSEELLHQILVLNVGLRNTIKRAKHTYKVRYGREYVGTDNKQEFEHCLKECMKCSVEHHLVIIQLFADFRKLMHIPLFTVIFDGGALICLAVVVILTNDDPSVILPIPFFVSAELYYTYVYCGYGERLTSAFSEVGYQLYLDDWYLTEAKVIQPYLEIIRSYSFIPKELSALGFATPNHQMFGSILRTAYSFSNVILARD
uniref:Odorant receptor n=1 Tax=Cyrtorhinus lividipennis TaxID=1032904 RepID=A0A346TI15_9HEMI|nr:odorant receptor 7 [Cyrtorhinus lividipennis]